MTGLEYIKGALEILGVYSPDNDLEDSDGNLGLRFLNAMLDGWTADVGPVYAETQESFALTTAKIQYTIGPTGDFVTTRPVNMIRASIRDAQDVDHKLDLQPNSEYQDFALKDPGSSLSWALGYNMTFPNVTLLFYPPPDSSYSLRLTSYKALSAATLASTYSVPPGYDESIIWNLAVRLAPTYGRGNLIGSATDSTSISGQAAAMYRRVLLTNLEPTGVNLDPMQPGNEPILRSWRTDAN